MIKTGLYRIEDLTDLRKRYTVIGGYRRVSIALLDQLRGHPDADAWAEHILYLFADGRGAFKRTYQRRFEEFDAFCLEHIARLCDRTRPLAVHDAAVSDGRTACDFFARLAAFNPQLSYAASDYQPTLRIISKGAVSAVLDCRDLPLELVYPPFVFNLIQPERYLTYPINYLFSRYATRVVLPRLLASYRAGTIPGREMTTFSPRATALAAGDQRFTLRAHDLLEPSPLGRLMDIVRVMNALNPLYFSSVQLAQVARHLFQGLSEGGVLIVGSNEDAGSAVHGGIYQRTAAGFTLVAGQGREHYAHQALIDVRAG